MNREVGWKKLRTYFSTDHTVTILFILQQLSRFWNDIFIESKITIREQSNTKIWKYKRNSLFVKCFKAPQILLRCIVSWFFIVVCIHCFCKKLCNVCLWTCNEATYCTKKWKKTSCLFLFYIGNLRNGLDHICCFVFVCNDGCGNIRSNTWRLSEWKKLGGMQRILDNSELQEQTLVWSTYFRPFLINIYAKAYGGTNPPVTF